MVREAEQSQRVLLEPMVQRRQARARARQLGLDRGLALGALRVQARAEARDLLPHFASVAGENGFLCFRATCFALGENVVRSTEWRARVCKRKTASWGVDLALSRGLGFSER